MLRDLARLDPATVELWNGERWTRVTAWERTQRPEHPLELVLRSGERIGCTTEHRWPTQRGLVEAGDLRTGDVLDSTLLPNVGKTPAWLNDNALWFAGLYLAEGSMSGDTIQLSGHVNEVARWARIQQLCEHYGASPRIYEDGNKQAITIDRSAALRAILDTVLAGRTAKDKRLHGQVWEWSNRALHWIVAGYLSGDGSYDAANDRYRLGFTRNYGLERDLRTLAARLDASLTLHPTFSTIGERRYPSFRGEWRWERSEHWNAKDRNEIVEIRNSRARHFYDVAVEDAPHLFALASSVLTHNSNPMPESVRDRPTGAARLVPRMRECRGAMPHCRGCGGVPHKRTGRVGGKNYVRHAQLRKGLPESGSERK